MNLYQFNMPNEDDNIQLKLYFQKSDVLVWSHSDHNNLR